MPLQCHRLSFYVIFCYFFIQCALIYKFQAKVGVLLKGCYFSGFDSFLFFRFIAIL